MATLPRLRFSGLAQEAARFIKSFVAQTRAIKSFAAQQNHFTTIATQMARNVEPFCTPPPWPLAQPPPQDVILKELSADHRKEQDRLARVMQEVAEQATERRAEERADLAKRIAEQLAPPTPPAPKPRLETRGRSRNWAYEEADLAVLSAILRGKTAKPTTEAEVKRLLRDWLQERYADEPADSKLREHAKLLLTYIRD